MSTGVAIVMAAVVIVAIGGMFLFVRQQQAAAQRAATDPWALVGGGAGNLIQGIGRLATGANTNAGG